ncbi:MAG: hypothetical protein IH604_09115 [Burkholderiales bacterium]|nr:hypothetical protein [Burkholderiales bacterium]
MSLLLKRMKPKERRGSKPRCHLLTDGAPDAVAARLTALVAPFAYVSQSDRWMPQGFAELEEAQLHKAPRLLPAALSKRLGEWWLPLDRQDAMTPNFDIASTCTIDGVPGLLLVEAKAHEKELMKEAAGRRLEESDSRERKVSHATIGAAIESARMGLEAATRLKWQISRDSHYQMSNRFAWSWKLTDLRIPVVLVYLGFLKTDDMSKPGEVPFADAGAWEALVMSHSARLFPSEVWSRRWLIKGMPFIPLIRSCEVYLNEVATA